MSLPNAIAFEPCTDAHANLARYIRTIPDLPETCRHELLHLVQMADLQARMDRKRHQALRDHVMLPRLSLLDLLPPLPRFRRARAVR